MELLSKKSVVTSQVLVLSAHGPLCLRGTNPVGVACGCEDVKARQILDRLNALQRNLRVCTQCFKSQILFLTSEHLRFFVVILSSWSRSRIIQTVALPCEKLSLRYSCADKTAPGRSKLAFRRRMLSQFSLNFNLFRLRLRSNA